MQKSNSCFFNLILVAFFSFFTACLSGQTAIFVSPSGNDSNSGTSWGDAKKTLAGALEAASGTTSIYMMVGNYTCANVLIPDGVTVKGGYASYDTVIVMGMVLLVDVSGTDTTHRRYPGTNANWTQATLCTILDGNNASRVATVNAGGKLEGCVITHGSVSGNGGGVLINGGTVQHCVIIHNSALDNIELNGKGGGAYVQNNGFLLNCVVAYNSANNGPGVAGIHGTLINNTITENSAIVLPVVTTNDVANITTTTASCGGNVTSDGGSSVTARGVCWSTSHNPTISNSHTTDGTGLGNFSSNLTGLSYNTTYYVRAYATNGAGTAYGEERAFTTNCNSVTVNITGATTISYGNSTTLTASGVSSYVWEADDSTIGTSASVTVHPISTTAYTVTGTNTYGCTGTNSVTVTVYIQPTVITNNNVTDITVSTASCGGNVTSDGGSSVTARGVCWSTSHNPTISSSHTTDGTGLGNFTSNLTGLSPNTTYYVRAYATNGAGTAYGEERTFTTNCNSVTVNITGSTTIPYGNSTTLTASGASSYVWAADSSTIGTSASITVHPTSTTAYTVTGTNTYGCTGTSSVTVTVYTQPTVITNDVANITTSTASCGGNVTSDGGSSVTARGVCWSTSHNPTISNSHTSNGTGTGSFTSNLTGLSLNTTYYLRAYATNGAGTAYGEERTFTTNCNSVTVSITGTTTIPYGNSTTLTASGASSYVWAADSSTIGTSASVTVHPTSTTAYTVTGTNTYGCTGTSSVTVTVYTQPTVITNDVANITTTTASCGGNVISDGGSSVTARGVCWSISQNPTISNSHTSNGTGTGNFTSNLTGLSPNTTYYVRAYATNGAGTAYGEEKTFTTNCNSVTVNITGTTTIPYGNSTTLTVSGASSYVWEADDSTIGTSASVTVNPTSTTAYTVTGTNTYGCTGTNSVTVTVYTQPTVITNNVSNITTTTAFCGGNVTSDGGSSVTARGVCWSTSHDPTISNSHTSNGTGTGSFTSNLTGLSPNTTYYVRAYATNGAGTAYGEERTFTTNCNSVTVNITGTTTISYGNSTTLTVSGASSYVWEADDSTIGTSASVTVNPTSTTAYTVTGTNTYGCTGTNSVTVTVYTQPTVITNNVSNITPTTASCGGNVTSDGGSSVTARGVCWSTSHDPTISNSHTSNGTGTGSFTSNLTGLSPNTTYYVRAYATNGAGTAYGEERTFTTNCNSVTVNITGTTTISYGNSTTLTASGASSYVWKSGNSTIGTSASVTVHPTSTTAYTVTGTNTYGCTGTNSVTVTITYTRPTVITNNVTDITTTTASCGGNVTSDGGSSVTARGVCWSTSHNPTISNSYTSNGTDTGSFTSNLTGLMPYTTYHVRAYATNSRGTSYGNDVSFTTASMDGQPCPNASTVSDYDGNTYNTVQIGSQCWMKQNMRTTHYADGTFIALGSTISETYAYRYYPNGSAGNVTTYGYLYNGIAAMKGTNTSGENPSGIMGVCPMGWHVPSAAEWDQLTNYVSSVPAYYCGNATGNIAKALASTTGWSSSTNTCAVGNMSGNNNATGFRAMPAGLYASYVDNNGFNGGAFFWSTSYNSSTSRMATVIGFGRSDVYRNAMEVDVYQSVRCVRD